MPQHSRDSYADQIWRGEIKPGRPADSTRENVKAVSRIWVEIWNQGLLATCDEVFAPGYIGHLPLMDVKGPEEFKQLVSAYRNAYPDVHLTVEDVFADGDRVAVRWTSRGTHQGSIMGIPPSGNKVEVMGISLFRMANGQVAEEWEGFDTLKMMQQIGAIPAR